MIFRIKFPKKCIFQNSLKNVYFRFFLSKKLTELHCFVSYLSNDPRNCIIRSSATTKIARNADDAIQGHSRSSVVVPIEVAYMT